MKTPIIPFAAAMWLACPQLVQADTIHLTNGEKIEGKVLREEDGNYIVIVSVSDTIRDEKTIAKSDVKRIERETEDAKAFKKIEGFVPTPELLSKADYESRIEKVEAFINSYPKSDNLSDARAIHDYLTEEYKTVRNGGIKFGEEMVSPEDYMANSYEYDAIREGKRIKEAVGRRDFLGALRAFTKYDQTFSDAEGRGEIVTLIKQVLAAYGATIEDSLASLDSRMEKRESGLATMAPDDRAQSKRAIAEQEELITARYEKEKAAREPWVTPDAFHKASLDEARRQVESETKRLESKPAGEFDSPVAETYRVAWGKLGGGTDEEKKAVIENAKANGVPETYLERLRERAGIQAP